MTSGELTQKAIGILVKRHAYHMERANTADRKRFERYTFEWARDHIFGQPSHERTCYEKDGKHYLRSYNSHVEKDGEYYDGYNLWELDGENLKYLGGLHR